MLRCVKCVGLTPIPLAVNTDLNKAQLAGMSIFQYASSSAGSRDYHALSDELMDRMESQGRHRY